MQSISKCFLNDAMGKLSKERAWMSQCGVVRTNQSGCSIPVEGEEVRGNQNVLT